MHHRNYENLYYCNYENLYSKICKLQNCCYYFINTQLDSETNNIMEHLEVARI
jgi:hypothetical protein